jgi:uncharacterized protein
MVALARWLRSEGRTEESLRLMREALRRPLAETLVWDTLWHTAEMERKAGNTDAAVALWSELSTAANPYRAQAFERLGVHYEKREKNFAMALEMTRAARALKDSETLRKREERLIRRSFMPKSGKLL